MSATALATVVEGWAKVAGLLVMIAGAIFAGVQLRQEARARHLQAMMAVFADIRPPEVAYAQQVVGALPDGFTVDDLDPDSFNAVVRTVTSFARLGDLLKAGMVDERDIFTHGAFSMGSVDAWEKVKHLARGENARVRYNGPSMEYLAGRAQAYLLREGVAQYGKVPFFDADREALQSVEGRIAQARAVAL